MIIVMHPESTQFEIESVVAQVEARGWQTHLSNDHGQTIIGLQGNGQPLDLFQLGQLPGVRDVLSITQKFKVASRAFRPEDTTFTIGNVTVGGNQLAVIAGPCSVESREQLMETAHAVKEAGATFLRGGAYKPRTSPYAFQGMGEAGLELLAEAREILLAHRPGDTPVMLANSLGRPEEHIRYRRLDAVEVDEVDMLPVVLVGSSNSRLAMLGEGPRMFTPRGYARKIDGDLAG